MAVSAGIGTGLEIHLALKNFNPPPLGFHEIDLLKKRYSLWYNVMYTHTVNSNSNLDLRNATILSRDLLNVWSIA